MRAELAAELESTKQTILQNERRHKTQLDDLERKFIEAKQRLEQEASDRIAHSRQVYKEEVGKELDMESKQVRKENREMAQELKFHEETNARFQKLNTRLQSEVNTRYQYTCSAYTMNLNK
jgi:Skp family chaperone for outer membrane proteins